MKREFSQSSNFRHWCWCCPGHDVFPNECYNNRRSKKARSRDKKIEHRYIRRINKLKLKER